MPSDMRCDSNPLAYGPSHPIRNIESRCSCRNRCNRCGFRDRRSDTERTLNRNLSARTRATDAYFRRRSRKQAELLQPRPDRLTDHIRQPPLLASSVVDHSCLLFPHRQPQPHLQWRADRLSFTFALTAVEAKLQPVYQAPFPKLKYWPVVMQGRAITRTTGCEWWVLTTKAHHH